MQSHPPSMAPLAMGSGVPEPSPARPSPAGKYSPAALHINNVLICDLI